MFRRKRWKYFRAKTEARAKGIGHPKRLSRLTSACFIDIVS